MPKDSGYIASNNEFFDNETFLPNSLSSNFKLECQYTPIKDNHNQQNFIENLALNEKKTSTLKKIDGNFFRMKLLKN